MWHLPHRREHAGIANAARLDLLAHHVEPRLLLLLGFIALALYVFRHYQRFEAPLTVLTRGALGLVCVGFFASHLVLLMGCEDGASWLIILTAITAGSDTGAYFIGSRLGRRKLCPNISPNKTVEGGVGGIVGGVAAGLTFSLIFPVAAPIWFVAVLAIVLALAGMVGDLVEIIGREKILGCVLNWFDLKTSSYYGYGKYGKYSKYYHG